jgi:hypothetical protein
MQNRKAALVLDPPPTQAFSEQKNSAPETQVRFSHSLLLSSRDQTQQFILDSQCYSIGRHPDNSIVIRDETISRHHARLVRTEDPKTGDFRFQIVDGDRKGKPSRHGTLVNGWRCPWVHLDDQDIIEFSPGIIAIYRRFPIESEVCQLPRVCNPIIEIYKQDVDYTLVQANLKLSHEERLRNLMKLQHYASELRKAGRIAKR